MSSSRKGRSGLGRFTPPSRKSVVVAAALTLLIATNPVQAMAANTASTATQKAQQSKINGQISQLKSQLNEVSGDEANLLGQLDDINNRKAAVESQITDLQNQMAQAQADMDAANAHLATVQAQVDQAQAKLQAAQDALADSAAKMQDQAVDAYIGGQADTNLANFVLRSNDVRDASAASEYMQQIVQNRQDVVEQHRELQGQANDAKQAVAAILNQAQLDRATVAAREDQLNSQKGQLDQLDAQVQSEADQQNVLLAQVQSQKSTLQAQMDQLQAQSDSIATLLRNLSGGSTTPVPAGKGILANPVPGAPLTSPFGMRLDPVLNVYQLHAGQDFGVPTGTPIHAAADGTVVSVLPSSSSGGYGNYTCISHGGGLATCYAHQSKFMVTVGQHVSRGDVIGLSGSTGYATGPHLHFEVRVNGTPVNPLGYL